MIPRDRKILPEKHEIDKAPFDGLSWKKKGYPITILTSL
jgi:hypothetical protein